MSLILEALRKSEAERQRAGAPRLHSPTLAAPPPRRGTLGPVLVTAVAVALLAGTWWVGRAVTPAARETAVPTHVAAVDAVPASVPAPAAMPPPVATAPVAAPAHATPKPAPHPALAAPPPLDPVARPRELPMPAPASMAPIPLPPAMPDLADAPDADAPSADPALPGLGALSAEERSALPPLKLSMHVWSQDPARRFAIIDGQRVTEGALVAGGSVVEIRRDGVVVALGDRRLLLPRP